MNVYEYSYIKETVEEDFEKTEFFVDYSEMVEFVKKRYFEDNHHYPSNIELKEGTDYRVHDIGNKMEEMTNCETCGKEIRKYDYVAAAVLGLSAHHQCEKCFTVENNPFKELGVEA